MRFALVIFLACTLNIAANPFAMLIGAGVAATGGASPTPELLWWKLNEGTGTTLTDFSTAGVNGGTLSSSSMWTTVGGQPCIKGNGTSFFANTTSTLNYGGATKITLCMWMYSTWNATEVIAESSANIGSNNRTWDVYTDSTPHLDMVLKDQFGNSFHRNGTPGSAGAWHHYAIVVDWSVPNEKLYIDGVAVTINTTGSGASSTSSPGTYTLYFLSRGGSSFFSDDALDDIRIYNRELNTTEISQVAGDRQ